MWPSKVPPASRLLLLLGCVTAVHGVCNLNSNYLGVWWHTYMGTNVQVLDVQTQRMLLRDKATSNTAATYTCQATVALDPMQYMVRMVDDGSGTEECLAMYVSDNGLVQMQKTYILNTFGTDPATCPTKAYNSVSRGVIKDPFNFQSGRCGLPEGRYQTTYQEDQSTGKACVGDVDSYATINADSITLRTCYTGPNVYERPFASSLRCIAKFPAENIGGQTSGGDILILSYTDSTGKARFYCSRVKVDTATNLIYLSFDHDNVNQLFCDTARSSYNSKVADRFTALEFKEYDCQLIPCENGGQCVLSNQQFVCNCPAEYAGIRCEIANWCATNPCINGGFCSDQANGYLCECSIGFTGTRCEVETDECISRPCLNGGNCIEGVARYDCNCFNGYSGINCETPPPISACDSNPCRNGGDCTEYGTDYFCVCQMGYFGDDCALEDPCNRSPCMNGGLCSSTAEEYVCICTEGYGGERCERQLRDCRDRGCGEYGVCEQIENVDPREYECICMEGYSGTYCGDAPPDWAMIGIILGVIGAILLLIFLALCSYCIVKYCRKPQSKSRQVVVHNKPRPPTPPAEITTFVVEPPEQTVFLVPARQQNTTPRIVELPSQPAPPPTILYASQRAVHSKTLALPAPQPSYAASQVSWTCAQPRQTMMQVRTPSLMVAPRVLRPAITSTTPTARFLAPPVAVMGGGGGGGGGSVRSCRSRRSSMGSTMLEDMVGRFTNNR